MVLGQAVPLNITRNVPLPFDSQWSDHFIICSYRSSRPEVFCKKGVLKILAKFTGKHLCQSLFFNKVAGLRPATLFKKRLWYMCFPMNFSTFLRTPFFIEHLWWLLLQLFSYSIKIQL